MRLIDADALAQSWDVLSDGKVFDFYDIDEIANAPTVDAEFVRHGHWIETIENGKMKRVTSCCGDNQTTITCWCTPRYCPNCGAKMDGTEQKWMDEVSE